MPELGLPQGLPICSIRTPVILSVLYLLLRGLIGLVTRPSSSRQALKEVEIAVLRHQLKILRRQVRRSERSTEPS